MHWLSADLSKSCSGLALLRGRELVRTASVWPVGAKGRHQFGTREYETMADAWRAVFGLGTLAALVVEDGLGHRPRTAIALSEHRGRVLERWDEAQDFRPVVRVAVATWRKVIRETYACGDKPPGRWSWPKDGDACKALAMELVRQHFGGREVIGDEADAIWMGVWAELTGQVGRGFGVLAKAKRPRRAAKAA